MYWREILWLISWPLMIWVMYVVITSAIKNMKANLTTKDKAAK